ncbi:MAG: hypothetical protein JSU77_12380 [Fidelibacterota bacterium]|nr:MAG: hypothetical protein JSU77_12380 [Candidatus Neomarinimicrobiota bacterium]
MRKIITLATLLTLTNVITLSTVVAQEKSECDSIIVEKVKLGNIYTYQGKTIDIQGSTFFPKLTEFRKLLAAYPDAIFHVKKAEATLQIVVIMASFGGFTIGQAISRVIIANIGLKEPITGFKKPNWTLALAGAAILVLVIKVGQRFDKHLEKAVDIYNSNVGKTSSPTP